MLVLTRKLNESILIGSDIKVTVAQIRGDSIRIGVTAPKSIPVHREEVARSVVSQGGSLDGPHAKFIKDIKQIRDRVAGWTTVAGTVVSMVMVQHELEYALAELESNTK
mgnify:FL=1